jgi:predicted RNA-binding protein with TRAM domain
MTQLQYLSLRRIEKDDGRYIVEIPEHEIENGKLNVQQRFQIAVVGPVEDTAGRSTTHQKEQSSPAERQESPPVSEGDRLIVEIESQGEEDDGVALIDGYVMFVPGTKPGQEVLVEVERTTDSEAFASPVSTATRPQD